MRSWLTCLATLVALAVGGAPVGSQETPRERARVALPAEVFERLETLALEAARDGVPADPLFNKALEGMAKRVPPARLLPAVRAYSGRLLEARGALGAEATPPMLVAGADALQRGVRAETLRRLGQGGRHSPMAVLVLTDLVETGVETDRALELVREAMQQRMHDDRMLDITARLRGLVRQGHSPQEAAERIRQMMHGRRGPGGDLGPPVPPGSEPVSSDRPHRPGGRRPGGMGR